MLMLDLSEVEQWNVLCDECILETGACNKIFPFLRWPMIELPSMRLRIVFLCMKNDHKITLHYTMDSLEILKQVVFRDVLCGCFIHTIITVAWDRIEYFIHVRACDTLACVRIAGLDDFFVELATTNFKSTATQFSNNASVGATARSRRVSSARSCTRRSR